MEIETSYRSYVKFSDSDTVYDIKSNATNPCKIPDFTTFNYIPHIEVFHSTNCGPQNCITPNSPRLRCGDDWNLFTTSDKLTSNSLNICIQTSFIVSLSLNLTVDIRSHITAGWSQKRRKAVSVSQLAAYRSVGDQSDMDMGQLLSTQPNPLHVL